MSRIALSVNKVVPVKLGPDALLHHSWNTMPSRWVDRGADSLENKLHDALMEGVRQAVSATNRALESLHYDNASESLLRWQAFIVKVPLPVLDKISSAVLRRLIPLNGAIMNRRSTDLSFEALQEIWMPDFLAFQARRPWRASAATRTRYPRAGIWTVEVQPGVLSWPEVLRLHRVWQQAYTSVKYTLIVSALHALSNLSSGSAQTYSPGLSYGQDVIVTLHGKRYRANAYLDATDGNPDGPGVVFRERDSRRGYVFRGELNLSLDYLRGEGFEYRGRYYEVMARSVKGVRPVADMPTWGEVTQPLDPPSGRFITAMSHMNACTFTHDGGVWAGTGTLLGSLGTSLGTAWRYPPLGTDPAAWSWSRPTPRRDIVLGLILRNGPRLNLPVYVGAAPGAFRVASVQPALNQQTLHWGNILEEL